MDADLGPHLGELADQRLGTAVARIAHILPVGGAQYHDLRRGHDFAHVAQRITDQLRGVKRTGIVDVDRQRRDLEDVVVEAHQGLVSPDPQAAVLREAVSADPRAGENHVRVGRADLDRLDHLDQVHAVALGKEAPLVQKRQDGCPVGVLDNLAGLALDRAVENRQRELLDVENLGEKFGDAPAGRFVDAAANPPEVSDRRDIVAARHHPLVGVGQKRFGGNAPFFKGLLQDRVGDIFGGSRRNGRLDQDQTAGGDLLPNDLQALLERGNLGMTLAAVAESLLEVVALDVHDDTVGERQRVVGKSGRQGLFLVDAAGNQRGNLRVLRLDGGNPAVQGWDLPVGASRRALHPDDELAGAAGFPVRGIGYDSSHDGADEADAHHDDDLAAFFAIFCSEPFEALEFGDVVLGRGQRKGFASRRHGNRIGDGLKNRGLKFCILHQTIFPFINSLGIRPREP